MSKLTRIQKVLVAAVMAVAIAVPIAIAQSKDAGARHGRGGHWAEQGMGERGGPGGGMMGFRNLDLTDAQKAQMKQIRDSHSKTIQPIFEQIRAKRQEIRQASQDGAFNEALVTQKLIEIAPLEAKLQGEQFRVHQEMLSILTPEQKAKLDQAREQFKSKRAERGAPKQKSE